MYVYQRDFEKVELKLKTTTFNNAGFYYMQFSEYAYATLLIFNAYFS